MSEREPTLGNEGPEIEMHEGGDDSNATSSAPPGDEIFITGERMGSDASSEPEYRGRRGSEMAGTSTGDNDDQSSAETESQWKTEESSPTRSHTPTSVELKKGTLGAAPKSRLNTITSRRRQARVARSKLQGRMKQVERELERTKSVLRRYNALKEEEARRERLRESIRREIREEEEALRHMNLSAQPAPDKSGETENEAADPYQPLTDQEFRERVLQRFGYSVEQLRVLLEESTKEGTEESAKESAKESTQEEPQNITWIKVHKQHLVPDTLTAYHLPWKWDETDGNYLLIMQWIEEDLQEELFAHTKRLREAEELREIKAPKRHSFTRQDRSFLRSHTRYTDAGSVQVTVEETEATGDSDAEDGGQEYITPTCKETGEPLSFDVKMRFPAKPNGPARTHGGSHPQVPEAKCLEFSSSRISGDGNVDLYKKDATVGDREAQMAWIHLERDARNFDEFIRFASQAPGLREEDTALLLKLLETVRRGLRPAEKIDYLEHFVVRCEAQDPSGLQTVVDNKTATFMSFPYFSIESTKAGSPSHSRGLLQTYYHLEASKHLDAEQTVRKTGRYPANHIIFVPQMWAVVLSSRFLITCAPISLTHAAAHSLRIMDPPRPRSTTGPSIVHLTDHCQRVFYIPIDHCRTWFALMDKVTNYCVDDIDTESIECQIYTHDNNQVRPENWQAILSNHVTTILPLSVRLAALQSPPSSEPDKMNDEDDHKSFHSNPPELHVIKEKFTTLSLKQGTIDLVNRVPTWVREKDAQRQSQGPEADFSSIRATRRLLPASSGIISNVSDARSRIDADEHIYFEPGSPTPKDPLSQLNAAPEDTTEDTTGDPLPEQHVPNVPPVFTWATGKGSTDGPGTADGGTLSPVEQDTVHTEEHSLAHVCEHLHTKLTHDHGSAEVYITISPQDYSIVDMGVSGLLGVSIADLIKTETDQDGVSSDQAVMPPWKSSLKRVMRSLFRLLGFFMPNVYQCDVGDRYIGAVAEVLVGIDKLCGMLTNSTIDHTVREIVEVVDLSGANDIDLRGPTDLDIGSFALKDCPDCHSYKQYPTRQAAIAHLHREHFPNVTLEASTYWVMSHEQRLNLAARRTGEKILLRLADHCSTLEQLASEIRHGVSENGTFDKDVYKIPLSTVSAFQHLLTMVAYAATSTRHALEQRQEHNTPTSTPSTFWSALDSQETTLYGVRAERSFEKAKEEIFLMTFTHDDSWDIGRYQAGSPEFILLTLMADLRGRDSANNKVDLIKVYQQHMLRLETQVAQNPHHRLLRDLRSVAQELDIIRKFTNKQRLLCANYRSLLDPASFRLTTAAREAAFKIEDEALDSLIRTLEQDATEIQLLLEEAESLARRTQSGVEVRQEDHGKAILVFTTITVIFLPLSFVTSYLGMNTVDIRDMDNRQTVFWAISLPLTLVVVTLSLYIGFKGDYLQEALSRSWSLGRLSLKVRHNDPIIRPSSARKNESVHYRWSGRVRKRRSGGPLGSHGSHV
ncbi:hypothetical protein BJX76DRAFT_355033 [Aspergillus varians]